MLAEAAPEVIRGSRAIDHNGFVVYVVQGERYVRNREGMIDTISGIKAEIYSQGLEITREYTIKDLVPEYDPLIPPVDRLEAMGRRATVMLAAERVNPYVFIGGSTAREVPISTSQGYVNSLWSTRFVKEEQRRHGLGIFLSQETLAFHPDVKMVAMRTQNPAAIWSAIEAGVFQEGKLFPLQIRYGRDPLAQEVMIQLFYRFRRHSVSPPNPDTGVARGDYAGENTAYELDENHNPTKEIYERMIEEFKMNFQRGDAMYLVGYAA